MAAEALPAPTTTTRPLQGAGMYAGTRAAGSAAVTAASNMAFRRARGSKIMAFVPPRCVKALVASSRSKPWTLAAGQSLEGEWDSGTGFAVLHGPPCDERGWLWRAK